MFDMQIKSNRDLKSEVELMRKEMAGMKQALQNIANPQSFTIKQDTREVVRETSTTV